jgi:hypothetical protein
MTRVFLAAILVSILIGLSVAGGTALGRVIELEKTNSINNLVVTAPGNFPMSYQGFLTTTDGSNVPDGPHDVVFSIYETNATATAEWQETQRVNTQSGMFSTYLGLTNPINPSIFVNSQDAFLGLKVDSDSESLPRTRLAYVPYAIYSVEALHAKVADDLDCVGCIESENLGFDPTGPKGDKGNIGSVGPRGLQGEQGPVGRGGLQTVYTTGSTKYVTKQGNEYSDVPGMSIDVSLTENSMLAITGHIVVNSVGFAAVRDSALVRILADDSTFQQEIRFLVADTNEQPIFVPFNQFIPLPIGDHTLKVQWFANGDGQTITSANRTMNVAVYSIP